MTWRQTHLAADVLPDIFIITVGLNEYLLFYGYLMFFFFILVTFHVESFYVWLIVKLCYPS